MAEIKIDKTLFQERLAHFVGAWKADKRNGTDALFNGASSILVLMGKTEEAAQFQKNNAIHVCVPGCLRELRADTFHSFGYWATNSRLPSSSSPWTAFTLSQLRRKVRYFRWPIRKLSQDTDTI